MKTTAKVVLVVLALLFVAWLVQPFLFASRRAPTLIDAFAQRQGEEPAREAAASQPVTAVTTVAEPESAEAGLPAGHDVYGFEKLDLPISGTLERLAGGAGAGMLIDPEARRILWTKNEDELVSIASMTKLMTLLMVMRALEERDDFTMDTIVRVSPAAASMGGTQVWLGARDEHPLKEMLRAMMIQSANDAAYAIGEAVSPNGSIDTFIASMNRTAREIGMRHARFYNPHGLPGASVYEENRATAVDMMVLAIELHRYPAALRLAGQEQATFEHPNGKTLIMNNHNQLLRTCPGVYGLKTGFTHRAGFCVTVSCLRNGRVLLAVGTGFSNKTARNQFFEALLDWGFEQSRLLDEDPIKLP